MAPTLVFRCFEWDKAGLLQLGKSGQGGFEGGSRLCEKPRQPSGYKDTLGVCILNLGPVRNLGGNEGGQRAVGFLQVGLGDAQHVGLGDRLYAVAHEDRKSTRLNSSHLGISYA